MGGSKIKEMGSSSKGGIYEVTFGYHSKMGGYTTSMSDIPELYAIRLGFSNTSSLYYRIPYQITKEVI